jgi:hypothetical protein
MLKKVFKIMSPPTVLTRSVQLENFVRDRGDFYRLLVLARGSSHFRLDRNDDVKRVEPLSFVFTW